ncbi:hypothetical protein [Heyndrickxia camelliae]|uniref:Uncharacterized protein n=1 Tax=Heyndrickxia camelliae TaxID=1707093 RepID=A0A2N3LET6_9BACI|nr:hypothetical protein [Heyndrickxia camelliae]PKR83053.1 hypothetical protein CWO92_21185 [Heyndrickxia camelliae]
MEENLNPNEDNISTKKDNFWHLIAENDLFEMVEKSGFGDKEFVLFQKRRLKGSLLSTIAAIVPTLLLSKWFAFSSILFFIYTWRNYYIKEKREYQDNLREKLTSWYVFERLVVVYLKGAHESIFEVLKKVLDRLEESEFKSHLERLIIDITEDSKSVNPYLNFAERAAGGNDAALTFMTSLYIYKNSTHDSSVIDELSDNARKEMMRGIVDIRKIKEKGFYHFPTKITMLNPIPMFGYMAGVAVNVFMNNMNF